MFQQERNTFVGGLTFFVFYNRAYKSLQMRQTSSWWWIKLKTNPISSFNHRVNKSSPKSLELFFADSFKNIVFKKHRATFGKKKVQWNAEIRTSLDFGCSTLDQFKAGHFKPKVWIQNVFLLA